MNINYGRFVGTKYTILGFDKLKSQRNDSDVGIAYFSELEANPLSWFKLLKAYVEL